MIAQEIVGRPYLMLFGIKATTIVWVFIAIFLGLIFSMTMWPGFWRKIYAPKQKQNIDNVKWYQTFKFIPWQLALILIFIAVFAFIAGTFIGFSTSLEVMQGSKGCDPLPCDVINLKCPLCYCETCGSTVRITIPVS
jgi:hypothetical protein